MSAETAGEAGFRRELGLLDTTVVVVGAIIGVGIFVNPANVARLAPDARLMLLAWGAGGVLALLGGFAYAELGSRLPLVGGQYVYLARAWHPFVGFLYGFALLFVINGGAIAAVSIVFARMASTFVPISQAGEMGLAAAAIAVLTLVNVVGVVPGKWTNNALMAAKLLGIAGLFALALLKHPARPQGAPAVPLGGGALAQAALVLAALVPIMFSYGGWQNCGAIAGEIKNPARNLALGNLFGVLLVVLVYVGLNVAYLSVFTPPAIAASKTLAADVAGALVGEAGRRFVAALLVVSCLGWLSVIILTGPRLTYAMAKDGVFLRRAGVLSPRFHTPVFTLLLQAGISIALLLTNTYDELLSYVVFADWLFFGLAVAGLFVLRRRDPAPAGVFLMPGFPVTAGIFVLVAAAIFVNSFVVSPRQSLTGCALLGVGALLYAIGKRKRA
ncbi:MAG TPA: amino acid permease [Thermoanaerobaculia bacterium]|nr:amino acid permease [Thermoanaerobaculia bacterium]